LTTLPENRRHVVWFSPEFDLWPAPRVERLDFRRKVSLKAGHGSYEHWRDTDHDDLVLAAALTAWGAGRFPATTPPTLPTRRPSYWSGAQR